MDIEAKERLRNITNRLVGASYAKACDPGVTEEDFQRSVNALVSHLMKVRRRAMESYPEKLMA
jgi:hypothetical protein